MFINIFEFYCILFIYLVPKRKGIVEILANGEGHRVKADIYSTRLQVRLGEGALELLFWIHGLEWALGEQSL